MRGVGRTWKGKDREQKAEWKQKDIWEGDRGERGTTHWALESDRKISSNPSFICSQLYISLESELLPTYIEGEQQWDVIIYQIMKIFIYNGGCWFMCSSRLWILERPCFFYIPETSVYQLGFVLAALWQTHTKFNIQDFIYSHKGIRGRQSGAFKV